MQGLRQVALRSSDLDRSVGFYCGTLGLRLLARFDPPGLAFVDLGGVRLLLEGAAPSSLIYLQVDGLEATVEALRAAGVPVESDPHVIFRDDAGQFGPAGAEEWMAFVRDPDDNLLGLIEARFGEAAPG